MWPEAGLSTVENNPTHSSRSGPLSLVNHDIRLVASGKVQGNRQCHQISRQSNVLGTRHLPIEFVGDHQIVSVHSPSRSGRTLPGVGSVHEIVLAVKLHILCSILQGSNE